MYSRAASPTATSVEAQLGQESADLAVVAIGLGLSLGHLAEDGDAPVLSGAFGQVEQRSAHRGRVRVVGIIDDEAAAGEGHSPPRQRESTIRSAPCCARSSGSLERARYAVSAASVFSARWRWSKARRSTSSVPPTWKRHPPPARSTAPRRSGARRGRREGEPSSAVPAGTTATPRGSASTASALARNVLARADELQMLRLELRHERDVWSGDGGQLCDLAEPAHPQLDDEHLRVRLQPEHGERQPDLVVLALLGKDRRNDGRAERAEDVLSSSPSSSRRRRRPAPTSGADERRERGERGVLIVGNERRGAAGASVVDIANPGVEGDEQVARLRDPRVRMDPPDEAVRRPLPAAPEAEGDQSSSNSTGITCEQLVNLRRATSRSSNGWTMPATSCPCS